MAEVETIPQEPRPLAVHDLLEDLESSSEEDELLLSEDELQAISPFSRHSPAQSPSPSPDPSFEVVVQQGGKDVIPPPLHLALGL